MKSAKTASLIFCLSVLYGGSGLAARAGFDVVTMRNGDTHNGTVAQQSFNLETPYGIVAIPYGLMKSLQTGRSSEPDRIVTRSGDSYSGKLIDEKMTMLRTLDPMLPLHTADLSDIAFASRSPYILGAETPDLLILNNGDSFAASVLSSDFLVLGKDGIDMVNRWEINYLDLTERVDSGETLVQITRNNGKETRGLLSSKSVRVRTEFDATLEVNTSEISAIVMRVNHSGRRSGYLFRQRFNPHDLIRDKMGGGIYAPPVLALRGGRTVRGDIQGQGDTDEQPIQEVTLKPFAIGIHEVTFQEYDHFCEDTGRTKPDDEQWGRATRPVVNVSWEDATAYTRWLSKRTNKVYRLPTDAEWEYAARAGTDTLYWWGNNLEFAMANCEGCGSLWDGDKTAPVGRFPPNPFGLHDTAGNVFEWTADCWSDRFDKAPADGSAMIQTGCGKRVIRGGAWSFPAHEIRSANRWRDFPSRSSDDTGFRVAREFERN